ncbi:MAG: glycoside hydrolase family 57 protein [Pseudomonadota bacterium]|nr:glycoside hydrolase family 57 protein [Pseudomonadota bacterium]MDP1902930.1 glycoside hydrolase family 57 protein [Pseudomonadota bacterium]MDP2353029.1 glycoside hydrolase family 57 protein [Pseudomonadota bacterium]
MLNLILCWHFHQPDYRDADGRYQLPWTYLHVAKDYADMAAHLEAAPNLRCVVNFVPSLVEQIDDYAGQFASGEVRDPLLAHLIEPDLTTLDLAARRHLVAQCFKLNHATMLEPFPAYRRLHTLWKTVEERGDAGLAYLSGQYLADLVTWYHLAWTGETVRRARADLLALMAQGEGFTLAQRRAVFDLYGDIVSDLIPRYRYLAERGQIELSSTPHSHPILPLLLDFKAAQDARPHLPLPDALAYPDGRARAMAHIEAAVASHIAHFGQPPTGFWPAEGGVSEATVHLFSEAGVKWAASGEGVLRHSLEKAGRSLEHKPDWITTPYRLAGSDTVLFFRDDHLSDLIGFEYKGWFGADAVRHMMHALDELRRQASGLNPVVSIIMDGENAWEYFPYNGFYFLSELFAELSTQHSIRPTTFSEYLELYPDSPRELPRLAAGSWVYGDFTTWMGDPAKNRGWDWLCAAKLAYDAAVEMLPEDEAETAEVLLKSCESSDWFWWFGDYNPADAVESFDRVYRQKLKRLYQTLRIRAPEYLDTPLCRGSGHSEAGGVMRRGGLSRRVRLRPE